MSDVKINYAAIAEKMGPECTAKAIIHRIAKIKDTARKLDGGEAGAEAEGGNTPPTTPAKSPGSAKRRRSKATGVDGIDETDSPSAKKGKMSPRVKPKPRGKAQAPSGVKQEAADPEFTSVKKEELEEDSNDGY
ncbi:hypothetical protein A1O3_05691 [Capronia epimyces CBS 606.96]|uniref:Uncharacterized protein n=1 Tax=Capronia epimyces CBS 606.96 TaxID=1182542 RepID=W9Y704_9EURO|nr:uncharacterized protein A1O3_05691 [Capronia epimyces CBS 606.96]EXJ85016.1 hypothetical protein A1O3_05691 [Capronia epimyces CBS 606.96]